MFKYHYHIEVWTGLKVNYLLVLQLNDIIRIEAEHNSTGIGNLSLE